VYKKTSTVTKYNNNIGNEKKNKGKITGNELTKMASKATCEIIICKYSTFAS